MNKYFLLSLLISTSQICSQTVQVLSSSTLKSGDQFGSSVAISDNYAFVGAPGDSYYRGAVYIFQKDNKKWILRQKICASDSGKMFSMFGASLAVSSKNLIVGNSPYYDVTNRKAYIYEKEDSIWIEKLKIEMDTAKSDLEILSVDISDSFAVIGNTQYIDSTETEKGTGIAYVYKKVGNSWLLWKKLEPSLIGGDFFGEKVVLSKKYIVIGCGFGGYVYLFEKVNNTWVQKQILHFGGTEFPGGDIIKNLYILKNQLSISIDGDVPKTYIFANSNKKWELKQWFSKGKYSGYGEVVVFTDKILVLNSQTFFNNTFFGAVDLYKDIEGFWYLQYEGLSSKKDISFGESIAISGNNLIVGEWHNSEKNIITGKAYLYTNIELLTSINKKNNFNSKFNINQNYPNPFNPSTTITYSIPITCQVNLTIYDILGNKIITLVNEKKNTGNYKVNFNAENLSSGIYIYRLKTPSFSSSKKMLLIK